MISLMSAIRLDLQLRQYKNDIPFRRGMVEEKEREFQNWKIRLDGLVLTFSWL